MRFKRFDLRTQQCLKRATTLKNNLEQTNTYFKIIAGFDSIDFFYDKED